MLQVETIASTLRINNRRELNFAIRKWKARVSMRADRAAEVRHHGVADVLEPENFGINME